MIKVGNFEAEGPYYNTSQLVEKSGVYVILTRQGPSQPWMVIDVGESATVQSRVEYHDRQNEWQRENRGELSVAVIYTPSAQQIGRMLIEQELREQFTPPCGKR